MLDPKSQFGGAETRQKIVELRNSIKDNSKYQKTVFMRNWFRAILYFIGNQWVTYYSSSRSWESPRNMPDWFPTPVTNKFASAVNTIIAILVQKDPVPLVTPSTKSDSDIATAEVADNLIPVLDKETDMPTFRKIAATWNVIAGNVFCHQYATTSPENGMIEVPVTGPDGQQTMQSMPKTKLHRDACSPFEIHCEQQVEDIKKIRNFVRTKTLPIEDIKKLYPDDADLIVADESGGNVGQDYMNTLAFTATNMGASPSLAFSSNAGRKDKRGALDYLYDLPSKDFPDGIVAVLNGETVLEAMPLKGIYSDVYGKPFLPLSFCGHTFVPGRLWHKCVSDDLLDKQTQRNKLECFIELIIFRMAKPGWLVPDVCGDVNIGGEPGQIVSYTEGPRGEKPSVVPAQEVPHSVIQRIEQIDKEFEDLAKTYDALKGQSPTNVNTFAGLKLLTERGYSSHLSMIRNWETFMGEIEMQGLDIARNTMVEQRSVTFKNELGDWETRTFQKADIQGGVDVQIEAGSSIPRSQAAEQGSLVDSIKLGLIDIRDPQVHYEALKKLGQGEFKNDVDIDVKDARSEWKQFLETGKTRPRKGIDNEQIHLKDAQMRAKTPEFFNLRPEMQATWIEHVGYHDANVREQMARQAMAAAPGGGMPVQGMPGSDRPANSGASGLNIDKLEFNGAALGQ